MLLSLAGGAATSLGFVLFPSLEGFLILAALSGAIWPVGAIATNAMVADLVPSPKRPGAYALLRVAHNVGFALGPALGGFMAVRSFAISFSTAAGLSALIFFIFLFAVRETLPAPAVAPGGEGGGGYRQVLRDVPFLSFSLGYTILQMAYMPMLSLLAIFLKEVRGIPESGFGLLMMTNGAMVVLFQVPLARFIARYPRMTVMAMGSVLVALGSGSVAYLSSFDWLWLATVVYTVGELLWAPTSLAVVADLSSPELRGRYMAVHSLSGGAARGLGPVVLGYLSDAVSPSALWQGTFVLGLVGAGVFWILGLRRKPRSVEAVPIMGAEEGTP
jgi:MFS family permease